MQQRYNWNAVIATVALMTDEPNIGNCIKGEGFTVDRTDSGFTICVERRDTEVPDPAPINAPEPDGSGTVAEAPAPAPAAAETPPEAPVEVPAETPVETPAETPAPEATGGAVADPEAVPTGQ